MKHHLSLLAVAVVAFETAAAASNLGGGRGGGTRGGGGHNWYLRAPDGSSQGPYALPQLGEWSSAGYVSPGELCAGICDGGKVRYEMLSHRKNMLPRFVWFYCLFELPIGVAPAGDLRPVATRESCQCWLGVCVLRA